MTNHGRITASRVAPVVVRHDVRPCIRCGRECRVNGSNDRSKPHMCGDCKSVDPAMVKRLGL